MPAKFPRTRSADSDCECMLAVFVLSPALTQTSAQRRESAPSQHRRGCCAGSTHHDVLCKTCTASVAQVAQLMGQLPNPMLHLPVHSPNDKHCSSECEVRAGLHCTTRAHVLKRGIAPVHSVQPSTCCSCRYGRASCTDKYAGGISLLLFLTTCTCSATSDAKLHSLY